MLIIMIIIIIITIFNGNKRSRRLEVEQRPASDSSIAGTRRRGKSSNAFPLLPPRRPRPRPSSASPLCLLASLPELLANTRSPIGQRAAARSK